MPLLTATAWNASFQPFRKVWWLCWAPTSVSIDTVLYFQITDPKAVTYEVANPLQAIEQPDGTWRTL